MLFFQANIGIIASLIFALILAIFFPQIRSLSLVPILVIIYVDITIHSIAFEYQRISLTLARIAKIDSLSFASLPITQAQLLLSSTSFSTYFFFSFLITGFLLAYLYLLSPLLLVGYLILKYFLADFIPTYKPYKLLFNFMDKEFKNNDLKNPITLIYKTKLKQYFDEMPHTRKYEDWAVKKYGVNLLKVK
jgi:hypothetical protein